MVRTGLAFGLALTILPQLLLGDTKIPRSFDELVTYSDCIGVIRIESVTLTVDNAQREWPPQYVVDAKFRWLDRMYAVPYLPDPVDGEYNLVFNRDKFKTIGNPGDYFVLLHRLPDDRYEPITDPQEAVLQISQVCHDPEKSIETTASFPIRRLFPKQDRVFLSELRDSIKESMKYCRPHVFRSQAVEEEGSAAAESPYTNGKCRVRFYAGNFLDDPTFDPAYSGLFELGAFVDCNRMDLKAPRITGESFRKNPRQYEVAVECRDGALEILSVRFTGP